MKKKILFSALLLLFCSSIFTTLSAQNLEATETEALLHVKVTDMEGKLRVKDLILFEGEKNGLQLRGISNAEGKFSILLPEGDTYLIKIAGLGDEESYSRIVIGDEEGVYEGSISISYEPAKVFTLDNVHFDFAKASLRSDSYAALDDLVEILNIRSTLRIEIAGHTDNVGNADANLRLSQSRAESVVKYLISKGIAAQRLVAKGYGAEEPIADNESPEGRQKNRRTEARILEEADF